MLKNLKISAKLLIGFMAVVALSIFLGLFCLAELKELKSSSNEITGNWLIGVHNIHVMNECFGRFRNGEFRSVIARNESELQSAMALQKDRLEAFRDAERTYVKTINTENEQKLYNNFKKNFDAFLAEHENIMRVVQAHAKDSAAGLMLGLSKQYYDAANQSMAELVDLNKAGSDLAKTHVEDTFTMSEKTIYVLIIIMLILGMIIALYISKLITAGITKVKELAYKIALGDLTGRVQKEGTDELAELTESLLQIRKTVVLLVDDMNNMSNQHDAGDIDVKIEPSKFEGAYRKMAEGVNNMVFGHIAVKKKAMACVAELAQGNFDASLEKFPGKKSFINENLEGLRANLKEITGDVNKLSDASIAGKLKTRADANRYKGGWHVMVKGINDTLDAIVGPLDVTANYIERIANGDIPQQITDTYNGDFNNVKNNLNLCIRNLNLLINEMNNMSNQHDLGDIDIKIDSNKFEGAYRRMADGVNNMVFGHIAVKKKAMACVAEFGQGNFDAPLEKFPGKKSFINDNMEALRTNLKEITGEVNRLSDAAIAGRLQTRAEINRFKGGWHVMVKGINDTLDAVINPLNVAAKYLERISLGDIPSQITDSYNGDFNTIKNNLNVLIDANNNIVSKAKQVAKGDLTIDLVKRSEKDELIQALVDMVKAIAYIVSEVQGAADNVASGSEQMSTTTEQMTQGASEQASAAEEVSSSMDEMVANINQNADNAQQTERIAVKAAKDIEESSRAVSQTVISMKNIADKITIVSEIAGKIDLLAINAAIEAARAGEHGKGFAVVAGEVRKLAERSQLAAVQINELSRSSVIVAETSGKLLADIVPDIQKTARLVQEIAAASAEQNTGATQVNTAIQQLNQVTQQNAASAEELSTSSEELSSMAFQLKEAISFFKTNEDTMGKKAAKTSVYAKKPQKFMHSTPSVVMHKGIKLNMKQKDITENDFESY